jgi:hypothetical protein
MNYREVSPVAFPAFSGININMMPFIMGDEDSIPDTMSGYLPMLRACEIPADEIGQVGYLTIDERFVESGTHRRGGVHTEGFGATGRWGGGGGQWGGNGGLFIANSVPDSCIIYDGAIPVSGPGGEVTEDQLGGLDSLLMDDSTLYWIHDRTPHASLPVSGNRQFFRMVTSEVSVWFADHSTVNPLGIAPRGRIIHGSKFS